MEPASELLYLDDLQVGRRFTSGTHALDERQITTFAREFDPQPFHVDGETVTVVPLSEHPAARDSSCVGHPCSLTVREDDEKT